MFHAADEAAGRHSEADADVHLREEREERVYEREAAQIGLGVLAREDGEIHRQNTHAARVIEERRGDV